MQYHSWEVEARIEKVPCETCDVPLEIRIEEVDTVTGDRYEWVEVARWIRQRRCTKHCHGYCVPA